MRSTASYNHAAPYVGADLTDRYARVPRPIDVCGLWPIHRGWFEAGFWTWEWRATMARLEVAEIAADIRGARSSMLDAPQALAAADRSERACERACRTPGKTPDHLPAIDRPFGGFVRSSVELFDALHRLGVPVSPPGFVGGVSEYYPGDAWPRLTGGNLPKKSTTEGRRLRRRLLEALGAARLPDLPTHDENDACLGAILAAAADEQVPGLEVVGVGEALMSAADGGLREGRIAVPCPDRTLARRLTDAIAPSTWSAPTPQSAE